MRSTRIGLGMVATMLSIGMLTACDKQYSDDRPSADALGHAAYEAEFVTDKSDITCVGDLLYHSELNDTWLSLIVDGALDQDSEARLPIDEGDYGPQTVAYYDVESKMLDKCNVHPYPELDRWPSDPDKFY